MGSHYYTFLLCLWATLLSAFPFQGRTRHLSSHIRATTDRIPEQAASRLAFGEHGGVSKTPSPFLHNNHNHTRRGYSNSKQSKYSPIKKNTRSEMGPTLGHAMTSAKRSNIGVPAEVVKAKRSWVFKFLIFAKNDKPDEAIATLCSSEYSQLARYLELRDYNLLLKELGDRSYFKHCSSVLAAMAAYGHKPTVVTYSTLISRAANWQKIELAEKFFADMQAAGITADVQAYNSLINAYAKGRQATKAQQCFADMRLAGITPSIVTYNTLIDAYARSADTAKAREVYDNMRFAGLVPNQHTYSSLVHAHCQAGQTRQALQLITEMEKDLGILPSGVVYSALLHGLGKEGNLQAAFEIVKALHARKVRPNIVVISSLIHACGTHGELDLAFSLYDEIRRSNESSTRPNSITCSSLVDACLKAGEVDRAFLVLNDMKASGIKLTEVTYTSLITELTRLRQLDRILEIVGDQQYEALSATDDQPPPLQLSAKLTPAFPRSAKTIRPVELQQDTEAEEGAGGVPALSEIKEASAARTSSDSRDIFSEYENLRTVGLTPDKNMYRSLIQTLVDTTSSKLRSSPDLQRQMRHDELFRLYLVFQEMRFAGVKADAAVYNTLINACASAGDVEKALETVEVMQSDGLPPDVITYTSLIKASLYNGGPGSIAFAEDVFESMQQRTNHFSTYVEPNELTFQRLIQTHLNGENGSRGLDLARVHTLLRELAVRGLRTDKALKIIEARVENFVQICRDFV